MHTYQYTRKKNLFFTCPFFFFFFFPSVQTSELSFSSPSFSVEINHHAPSSQPFGLFVFISPFVSISSFACSTSSLSFSFQVITSKDRPKLSPWNSNRHGIRIISLFPVTALVLKGYFFFFPSSLMSSFLFYQSRALNLCLIFFLMGFWRMGSFVSDSCFHFLHCVVIFVSLMMWD